MRKVAINEIHKNTPATNKLRTFTQKTKKKTNKKRYMEILTITWNNVYRKFSLRGNHIFFFQKS